MPGRKRLMPAGSAGVTLIEVLVTLVVLAIGMLGLAGLQLATLNGHFEAYQRAQALLLAEDMAGRIRANAAVARDPNSPYTVAYGENYYGTLSDDDCTDEADIAQTDLCEWNNALIGSSVAEADDPNAGLASIVQARGCIDRLAGSGTGETSIRVTVAWRGSRETVAPALDCAEDEYGDDRLRRTVAAVVTLATLFDPNAP